jgi:predicted nucleic acid-binding protein
VIESSEEVSRTWGRLAASLQRRGVAVSENDLWVAACRISDGLPL